MTVSVEHKDNGIVIETLKWRKLDEKHGVPNLEGHRHNDDGYGRLRITTFNGHSEYERFEERLVPESELVDPYAAARRIVEVAEGLAEPQMKTGSLHSHFEEYYDEEYDDLLDEIDEDEDDVAEYERPVRRREIRNHGLLISGWVEAEADFIEAMLSIRTWSDARKAVQAERKKARRLEK